MLVLDWASQAWSSVGQRQVTPQRGCSLPPGHLVKLEVDLFMREEEPQDSSWGDLMGQPWGGAGGALLTRAQGRDGLEASETKAATRMRLACPWDRVSESTESPGK